MLIKLRNVHHTYLAGTNLARNALHGIDFSIAEGEFVAIAGATGSGKSTLIQHFNGLLTPTTGTVFFSGKQIGIDIQPHEVRRDVGLLFQFPENQLFEETVARDVAYGLKNMGLSKGEIDTRVRDSLECIGLNYVRYSERSPLALSGGEKRLVAIAGVLAMKPRMLVLDEPTSGLDHNGRMHLIALLRSLNSTGTTIVMVNHDMDEIAENASRVVVLDNGEIIFDGAPADVFNRHEALTRIGLGIPHTVELVAKLRGRGLNVVPASPSVASTVEAVCASLKEKQCR
ncbi:MAG TPA: energy-coupling factor transporter ATPase [Candidatus Aquicultor sp.]|jgi:energy-coupling factor transport system ATP-binding protein